MSRGPIRVWVKGYAFQDNNLRGEESLGRLFLDAFENTPPEGRVDGLTRLLQEFNGRFAVVLVSGPWAFAAVDRVRSIPLFYSVRRDVVSLADSVEWLVDTVDELRFDPVAREEFVLTGYVTGADTLCAGVKQIQAGCFICVDSATRPQRIPEHRYYRYVHSYDDRASARTLTERLEASLVTSFERLVTLADGRTIVLPLSGGYDSCLVALMLKQLRYDNLVAFTYGRPGSAEARTSRAVAEALHIRWEFIPYSEALWRRWYCSGEWRAYRSFSHEFCTVPHLQDWPAVWRLRDERRVPEDSLFAPGHFADLPAGSKSRIVPGLYRAAPRDRRQLLDVILHVHYSLFPWTREQQNLREQFETKILRTVGDLDGYPDNVSALESWDVAERQAKFLVNSVRAYEFWGYRWTLPFLDTAFPEFWTHVPLHFRRGKWLYNEFVRQKQETWLGFSFASRKGRPPGWAGSVLESVRRSWVADVLRDIYRTVGMGHAYSHHPFAWYGIVSRDEFFAMYPRPRNINSVLAYLHLKGQAHAASAGAGGVF